jgi:hypothetical protein
MLADGYPASGQLPATDWASQDLTLRWVPVAEPSAAGKAERPAPGRAEPSPSDRPGPAVPEPEPEVAKEAPPDEEPAGCGPSCADNGHPGCLGRCARLPRACRSSGLTARAPDARGCGCRGCGACGGILDGLCLWSECEEIDLLGESCTGITAGGWFQGGFHDDDTGMFNNYPDHFNVHQAWLYSEKSLDTERSGWDWGYRVDYVYGTDGPDTQAFGNRLDTWDFGWSHGHFYGHAIPQLYGEVGYGNLSVKLGHFYTIVGYEVVPAPDNFFYSHAFTMYYAEPFTHTGALATYEAGDNLTFYGGWTAGFDTGFDSFGGDIFLGGVSMGLGENVTATYACTAGNIGFGTNASGYSHSVVVDVPLTERLNYVFQTDYIDYDGIVTSGESLVGQPGAALLLRRYGVNNYWFYEINDCLDAGLRFEWFNAEEGPAAGRSDLYALTFGLNYQPHPNLRIRPEVRWNQDDDAFTVNTDDNDEVGFGMDMILTF